jgi:hypothetical protein
MVSVEDFSKIMSRFRRALFKALLSSIWAVLLSAFVGGILGWVDGFCYVHRPALTLKLGMGLQEQRLWGQSS